MLNKLPFEQDIETKSVLKKLAKAHRALAELKGVINGMPNQSILIDTLSLQEAKDSSEIENIITTHDELYRSDTVAHFFTTRAAKEVYNYVQALKKGFEQVEKTGLLTNNDILMIQACIEENQAGFRKLPGTSLKNDLTGEVIYMPPQHPDEINQLMKNLELFINEAEICDWDVLTKMAVIHHQFESIHPFYDGNGRTGRLINILYLVQQNLLSSPILYLSRYINKNKQEYYRLLQEVRDLNEWENWLIYMLNGIEKTAQQTTILVTQIKKLMLDTKNRLRSELPKIYSQDLINNLFRHPYTKIDFVSDELQITRKTAARYLEEMDKIGIVNKIKLGKDNYYFNDALIQLLKNAGDHQNESESEEERR